jgi:Flp pilus assembly protein TadG
MKRSLCLRLHRQRGASAVELALILPILVTVLLAPLFITVFFWHYTVVQKAAQDGARYLATMSEREMREPALAKAAALVANQIIEAELAELGDTGRTAEVQVFCGPNKLCTGATSGQLPTTVAVYVGINLTDMFGIVDTGRYGWLVSSTAEMSYVGK